MIFLCKAKNSPFEYIRSIEMRLYLSDLTGFEIISNEMYQNVAEILSKV